MKLQPVFSTSLAILVVAASVHFDRANAENWPCWRGPRADGTSVEKNVPKKWDVADALWKIKIPGAGHASPIAWGNRVIIATGLPETEDRVLISLDRATGETLWQKTVVHGPLEKLHTENSYASGTPATDGKRVYANFRVGDEICVAAHDLATGEQLWSIRPGTHEGEWGFSNVPVLYKDTVIIDGDSKGKSFLIALRKDNGQTVWRVDRSRKGISYSAPFIRELAGRMQLIQAGDRSVTSFDPDTGKQLWTVDGPSEEFVASPGYSESAGLVFASSSYPVREMLAIKPDGEGDVTKTHVAWRTKPGATYITSPLTVRDLLLGVNNAGVAYCFEAATGKVLWKEKFGQHHSSPVLVEGLAYFISDEGEINVIKPGREFERVAQYKLGEACYASPAISDGQVFLRGFEHLFCIGKPAR